MKRGKIMEFNAETKRKLREEYDACVKLGLKLDMSRGKPGTEQLALSEGMLTALSDGEDCVKGRAADYRNYGLLDGIPEMRELVAELMDVKAENVIAGGNSSLNMMYDTISAAMLFGVPGSEKPWSKYDKISFLCVVPGYDRHFAITERMGINMINVPLHSDGPDMDMVESLVASDETIKGIWCVPKYSNPDGVTYSDETVRRMASLKPAAADFRIFWDNAYALHDWYEQGDSLLNIISETEKAGNPDMVFEFMSTSKVTFPGSGVAAVISSPANIAFLKKTMFYQTIGPDKLNQLRHVKFFGTADNLRRHMRRHADIIRPKFEYVLNKFEQELTGIAEWNVPRGGYFISLNVPDGCAARTVQLLAGAGVKMTSAGSCFPYGKDPNDKNIRIAPTYPSMDELRQATDLICLCVKLAASEKA